MRKHCKAHIFVNKTGTDETSENEEIPVYYKLVRLWIFSTTLTLQTRSRIFPACSKPGYWKNITDRDRDCAPEAQRRFDWQLHRENVSQHLQQCNSNKTFRIYQHISHSWENWHSAGPDAHISPAYSIYKNPLNSFACKEQSLFLFSGQSQLYPAVERYLMHSSISCRQCLLLYTVGTTLRSYTSIRQLTCA